LFSLQYQVLSFLPTGYSCIRIITIADRSVGDQSVLVLVVVLTARETESLTWGEKVWAALPGLHKADLAPRITTGL
jgi:hypothetical protein